MDLDGFEKALRAAAIQEYTLAQLFTLAIEFEAKTITADRYASRSLEILKMHQKDLAKNAAGG